MPESIDPSDAVELYLDDRKSELAFQSHRNHKYHLRRFLEWCDHDGFDDMSDMTGRKIYEYKQYRRDAGDVNDTTLSNQLSTLRVFLQFCENLGFVTEGTAEMVMMPDVDPLEQAREEYLDAEAAEAILDYCERMERATLRHAVFYVMWHCGLRLGSIVSLDVDDYHPDGQYIEVRHRPDSGTTLKNGKRGEREVHIEQGLCEVLDDYIQFNRNDVTDEYGREPLFSSPSGRMVDSVIRQHIYCLTRPCHYTGNCPHDREQSECEATEYDSAGDCPSSLSPHPVRRGAITAHLNDDVPKEIVSGRADVSVDVLSKHYDARSESEKRKLRKEYLEDN